MNYLVSTNLGNIYSVQDNKTQLLLKDNTKSIYTGDQSIRFIKKYNDGYILGKSESLLLWCNNGGTFKLPGLVDIKDIVISNNFCAILSGLRNSIYILNKELNNIITCFNINKEGKIEFFKDRQVQCQEIPLTYFQVFYCPGMNNYHKFSRLTTYENYLSIHNDLKHKYIQINLNDFSYKWIEHNSIYFGKSLINVSIDGERITDYIEC